MLNEEAAQRTFSDIHRLWIQPELERRFGKAGPPSTFRIFRCLIRMPKGRQPIVEFNDEIAWITQAKIPRGESFKQGDPLFIHQIEHVVAVAPPTFDGQRCAFIFVFRSADGHFQIVFDTTPNLPDADQRVIETAEPSGWGFSDVIADHLNEVLTERAVLLHRDFQKEIAGIGLWAAPALLPFPMTRIVHLIQSGDAAQARAQLVQFCTPDFLEQRTEQWWKHKALSDRRQLFQDALFAHRERRYTLSIHAVAPHLEGIITDWIVANLAPMDVPFRQESKTKRFRDRVLAQDDIAFTLRRVVESTMEFILDGPVLATFEKWLDSPDSTFPNRHVVGHGRFEQVVYTEENSIKLFLLVDTIAFMLPTDPGKPV